MSLITIQQAFNTAVTGLYAQGAVSIGEDGNCAYRNPIGLKCGVGFLIPDNVYQENFENCSASFLFETKDFKALFEPEVTEDFLDSLQREVHDKFTRPKTGQDIPYKTWLAVKAKAFALAHDLTVPDIIEQANEHG